MGMLIFLLVVILGTSIYTKFVSSFNMPTIFNIGQVGLNALDLILVANLITPLFPTRGLMKGLLWGMTLGSNFTSWAKVTIDGYLNPAPTS